MLYVILSSLFFSWILKHTCSQCFGMMQIKFRISVISKFEVILMKRKSALQSSSIHGLELKCYISIYLVLLKFASTYHMINTSIFLFQWSFSEQCYEHIKIYNFVSQFVILQVVISGCVMVGHVETHFHR